jgi:hypothetical protein
MPLACRFWPLAALLLIAGCAQRWEKPGATQAEFEVMHSRCEARSQAEFPPVMTQVMSTAGYTTPVQTNCQNSANNTNCRTTGGQYMPPTYRMVDQARDPRDRAVAACLVEHGWRRAD